MKIERVGVVGCGLMGSGVAEASALAGLDVRVVDLDGAAVERGRDRIAASIAHAQKGGKLTDAEGEAALARLEYSTDMDSLADRQLIVEAVIEAEAEKVAVFERLDKIVEAPDAVLASNTSSIPIMKLAVATTRPSQVIGIHFFNPVPVLPLVELVRCLLTSDETADTADHFASRAAREACHPLAGPGRVHRQRSPHPVHPLSRTHARVGIRYGGGHRRRHGQWLQSPHGAPRLGRPHRSRHDSGRGEFSL